MDALRISEKKKKKKKKRKEKRTIRQSFANSPRAPSPLGEERGKESLLRERENAA